MAKAHPAVNEPTLTLWCLQAFFYLSGIEDSGFSGEEEAVTVRDADGEPRLTVLTVYLVLDLSRFLGSHSAMNHGLAETFGLVYDVGKDGSQKEKRMAEGEMVRKCHQHTDHGFGRILGNRGGRGWWGGEGG